MGGHKAELFSGYAEVVVISKDFTPRLLEMGSEGSIKLIQADLSYAIDSSDSAISSDIVDTSANTIDPTELSFDAESLLKGAFLAIIATSDSKLNQILEKKAQKLGVLVNKADGIGDVVVPSIIERGPITVAISTHGQSPALARHLRLRLEGGELARNYGGMARILGQIRSELKQTVGRQKDRKTIFWSIILDEDIWSLLDESYEKAYKKAREHFDPNEPDSLDAGDSPKGEHRRD